MVRLATRMSSLSSSPRIRSAPQSRLRLAMCSMRAIVSAATRGAPPRRCTVRRQRSAKPWRCQRPIHFRISARVMCRRVATLSSIRSVFSVSRCFVKRRACAADLPRIAGTSSPDGPSSQYGVGPSSGRPRMLGPPAMLWCIASTRSVTPLVASITRRVAPRRSSMGVRAVFGGPCWAIRAVRTSLHSCAAVRFNGLQ
jgi:hypothetical protein